MAEPSTFFGLEADAKALYFVEARDRDPRSEEQRQLAFRKLAHMVCPAVEIFAVPNAEKRSQWSAAKRKREGMVAGVSDLICTWDGRGIAFVEFKSGATMPNANQHEWLNRKVRQGHHAAVFRQEASAIRWLASIGAPMIGEVR